MKKLNILRKILQHTGADKMLASFLGFALVCAFVFWIQEPDVKTFGDALWYCYAVITTIGFGDITVTSAISRILSVLLSIYSILIIAIITGVTVNYFTQIVLLRQKSSLAGILDRLEHLPELDKEELEKLSETIRNLR